MTRQRSAIEWQDIVAATFVVGKDLVEADYLTTQEAVDNLPVDGGCIYLLQGTFSLTTTVTLPEKSVYIKGSGNDVTIFDIGTSAIAAFTYNHTAAEAISQTFSDFDVIGHGVDGQIGFSVNDPGFFVGFDALRVFIYDVKYGIYDFSGASWVFTDCPIFVADLVGVAHYKSDSADLEPFLFIANSSWLGVNGAIKAGGIDGNAFVYAVSSRFDCGTVMNLGQVNISACRFAADGAPNKTVQAGDSRGVLISATEFRGGAYLSLVKNVTAGPFSVSGCNFRATPTRAIDVSADMTDGAISGCDFTYTSEAIRIAGSGIVVSGNRNCKVTETGAADSNTYTGNSGMTGSTLLGASSKIAGAALADKASTTTAALVAIVPTITNPKGLMGVGTIKNTDGANSLDVTETFTDAFGTSSTLTTTVAAGAYLILSLQQSIGTGRAPYVSYKAEVIDTVAGNHATYVSHFTSQGSL